MRWLPVEIKGKCRQKEKIEKNKGQAGEKEEEQMRENGIKKEKIKDKGMKDTTIKKNRIKEQNYTYIVQCSDGTYYTGWTNNLAKRIDTHNRGKGAKYTRSRAPVQLVYVESFETKEEAMSREYRIKKMSRKEKEEMIRTSNLNEWVQTSLE